MKKIGVVLFILSATLFASCDSSKEKEQALEAQITSLKKENDALRNKSKKQEATIGSYKNTLEEIDFNLNKIELNWALVANLETEGGKKIDVEERIKNRISFINKLISNSQLKISSLDKNLNELRKTSSEKSDEVLALDKALKSAARKLIDKEEEFVRQRAALNLELGDLEKVYEEQKAFTNELHKMLNRAYYFTGSAKDLRKNNIVDKTGGFIGIGKVKIMNASSKESIFHLIEKDKTIQLPLKGNKSKLITSHPANSYSITIENGLKVLTIIDRSAFWKVGNYLIIQTE